MIDLALGLALQFFVSSATILNPPNPPNPPKADVITIPLEELEDAKDRLELSERLRQSVRDEDVHRRVVNWPNEKRIRELLIKLARPAKTF